MNREEALERLKKKRTMLHTSLSKYGKIIEESDVHKECDHEELLEQLSNVYEELRRVDEEIGKLRHSRSRERAKNGGGIPGEGRDVEIFGKEKKSGGSGQNAEGNGNGYEEGISRRNQSTCCNWDVSKDARAFRELYGRILVQIRSLESLGVVVESYGNLLCPLLLKLLPSDLKLELHKEFTGYFSLRYFIEFLKRQLHWKALSILNEEIATPARGIMKDETLDQSYDDACGVVAHNARAEIAGKLLAGEHRKLPSGLVEVQTRLGWTLMGNFPATEEETSFNGLCTTTLLTSDLENIWRLEAIDCKGRYQVALPWIRKREVLTDNRDVAEKRLANLRKYLENTGKLTEYEDILERWLRNKTIEMVTDNEREGVHYLPFRPVFKENSLTTKIRPVFDASARKKAKLSLNDCLERGPNMIETITRILNRFRKREIGVSSEIEKAFLQIGIREEDKRLSKISLESLYIDNCVASFSEVTDMEKFMVEALRLWASANFNLHDWTSNVNSTMCDGPRSDRGRLLGMVWNQEEDTLACSLDNLEIKGPINKKKRTGSNIPTSTGSVESSSIPRLELLACLIGARLANNVMWDLKLEDKAILLDSYSINTLHWIKRKDNWATSVVNRVMEIRSLSGTEDWYHEPECLNPMYSQMRGCLADSLEKKKWWEGPSWLRRSRKDWPHIEIYPDSDIMNSEKRNIALTLTCIYREMDQGIIGQRLNWPLARVMEVYAGRERTVRVAKLRTSKSDQIRLVKRLYNLEIPADMGSTLRSKQSEAHQGRRIPRRNQSLEVEEDAEKNELEEAVKRNKNTVGTSNASTISKRADILINSSPEKMNDQDSKFEVWNDSQYIQFKQKYPWLSISKGRLRCNICASVKTLGAAKSERIHISPEWSNYLIEAAGKDRANKLSNIRMKIKKHYTEKRLTLFKTIIRPVLTYGSEIWFKYLNNRCKQKLNSMQYQIILWAIRAYKTTSSNCVHSLAKIPLLTDYIESRIIKFDLAQMSIEDLTTYEPHAPSIVKSFLHAKMNEIFENTNEIFRSFFVLGIPRFFRPNFYNIQFITDHGNFGKFLATIGAVKEPGCFCGGEIQDARHLLLECPIFRDFRENRFGRIGQLDEFVDKKEKYKNFDQFCKYIYNFLLNWKKEKES
ncbi:hypothetical protein LAZ67_12001455 [Cordylochernes scorpioides]|uniref:DUF5641 domain-containing protein n=1 Tax=Cordylochernes scorpioides TaxID=51811 RepID=A0ABY6L4N6_9ARAC|nr:hypothetical protein LAZ67_12001455 [Cordylochernes scorpioides]